MLLLLKAGGMVRPMATRRPRTQTTQQAAKSRQVKDEQVAEVFAYWKNRISPSSRAVLDEQRRQRIGWAIHDYGLDACKQAIDGILKSSWHMGGNPQNKRYADVELIFRNAANVEKFIELAERRDARSAEQEFINETN